jgi:tetratricopeptide (TPR) repeat protein
MVLADPVSWAFVFIGADLYVRANRLARDARYLLPPELQAIPPARAAWARGLLAATAIFALAFLGLVGYSRYQDSVYLLQPGVDVRREQQALLALNEGLDQFNKGDLAAAERSCERSTQLWEELTKAPTAPMTYRANLAQTLYNLAFLCQQRQRPDDALKHYDRIVALAPLLEGDPQVMNPEFRLTLAEARRAAVELRRAGPFKRN